MYLTRAKGSTKSSNTIVAAICIPSIDSTMTYDAVERSLLLVDSRENGLVLLTLCEEREKEDFRQ